MTIPDAVKGPDLRCGDWVDVLGDLETVDALICDPPFSSRTDKGFLSSRDVNESKRRARSGNRSLMPARRNEMPYRPLTEEDVEVFVESWAPRVRWWVVVFGDHISVRWWETWWAETGFLSFAPIPWIKRNAPPRFHGDGPANSAEWILVARPRHRLPVERRGSRPGYYLTHQVHGALGVRVLIGQKPEGLMRALVRDYTLPGDVVCDPFAGSGTTLLSAAIEGRTAVGAELDPETYNTAVARLRRGFTPTLFDEAASGKI